MSNKIDDLQKDIAEFCAERDWDQFHTPKDLAIGLVTEASELLDLFRFKTEAQCTEIAQSVKFQDELGDVMFFIFRMSERFNLDPIAACNNKLAKTKVKYPVDKVKGSNRKYNE